MGVLFYNKEPNTQLLEKTAFPLNFETVWESDNIVRSVAYAAFPDLSDDINEYAGVEFTLDGAFLSQTRSDIAFPGQKTLSMLASGEATSILVARYDLFLDEELIFSYVDELLDIAAGDFNNNYVTFTVPLAGTSAKITITRQGEGLIRISNPKLEEGSSPSRWSPHA